MDYAALISKFLTKRNIIIISVVLGVVLLVSLFFIIPTTRSYVTGVPVHFNNLGPDSTRDDIIDLYGEPIGTTKIGGFELYEAKFLNVKGHIVVQYAENSDKVYTVQFAIRSSDFKSYDQYKNAVKKTRDYFDAVLARCVTEDGKDGGKLWLNESKYAGYLVFGSNYYYDLEGPQYTLSEGITVFQYYTLKDEIK